MRIRRLLACLPCLALATPLAGCGSSGGGSDDSDNRPPVAVAGVDLAIATGGSIQLDGTASNDPDGDPITFQWTMTARPEGSTAALVDGNAPRPILTADRDGDYTIALVVSDGRTSSSADEVVVTATPANARPIARAGADRTVELGSVVPLDATESSDSDGDPLSVAWTLVSKPEGSDAGLKDPTSARTVFVADTLGEFQVSLVVSDGIAASDPDDVTITVVDTNVPPIAAAGADQSVAVGTVVTIDGSASTDADGDPLEFQWSIVSKPAGSVAGIQDPAAAASLFVADTEGAFVIQLIVHDGHVPSAADVMVVTASAQNVSPTARAGSDQQVNPGDTVILDGSASSDPDDGPLSFVWSFVSVPNGSSATLTQSASARPSFVADVAGTYVVRLIVNDGIVTSAADTVTVTAATNASSGCADPGSTLLCDSLDGSTSGKRDGGQFVDGGWTPGWNVVWDLGITLSEGAFSADLDNWDTYHSSSQHHYEKQPVLSMYQEPHGDNHAADAHGTSLWSIWTGEVFNDLFKFWSTTRGYDESIETRHSPPEGRLDPTVTHHVRVEFPRDGNATVFLDGRTVVTHDHPRAFQLRYVFVGSDNSGSNYGPQSGLIYKNIKVWGSTSGGRQVALNLSVTDGRVRAEEVPLPRVGRGLLDWLRPSWAGSRGAGSLARVSAIREAEPRS